ncbi:GNAT family N-acetyltransferase [Haladaptatus sp. DYSN1]|uniref:GNAT family N-acetyltransferase n=1 Tax=unclassified Haladaptatus TaxID=2622732 RepID=UPI0024051203|nr:GNAT family N-acetyltransferase [Haladaptatus sp. DYSN1]
MARPTVNPPEVLEFHVVTPDRWEDFETLFGESGACDGCWCMWNRQTQAEYNANRGAANRQQMHDIIHDDGRPGILAFLDGEPAGWCSVAPRETFVRLARSPVMKPIDDTPVWSIVCFYVDRAARGRGLTVALLEAAKEYVREQGGSVLEGYPVDPQGERVSPTSAWYGFASAFAEAGFVEVARRKKTRPIVRFDLDAT